MKFYTPFEEYRERNGQEFKLLRELSDMERDPEVGVMWKIRFNDGVVIDAWGDEVDGTYEHDYKEYISKP